MSDSKKIKITLTDRSPVSIDPVTWGTIAQARWASQAACEAQENERAYLRVRQHADGRAIVYGSRYPGPGGVAAGYEGAEGGELLEAGAGPHELAAAVRRLGEYLGLTETTIVSCLSDLPPEDLDEPDSADEASMGRRAHAL